VDYFKVLSLYLSGETEDNHEKCKDSNPKSSKYELGFLTTTLRPLAVGYLATLVQVHGLYCIE
jgi:predicted O-linked N-acetylglucosamine transferase (SPINDLY family)